MKPAAGRDEAVVAGFFVGAVNFGLYVQPYPWLGGLIGTTMGVSTFLLLRTTKMNLIRRFIVILFSTLLWLGFASTIEYLGFDAIQNWSISHTRPPFIPTGPAQRGGAIIPDPLIMHQPSIFLTTTEKVGFKVYFPIDTEIFAMLIITYILSALALGRGLCGWACHYGGITEAFTSGKRGRWRMKGFRETFQSEKGPILTGLKEGVRYIKYGVMIGMFLLSFVLLENVLSIFSWFNWFLSDFTMWSVAGLILIFFVVLPFMTKKRWWCLLLCPIGAIVSLFDRITPLTVKIDGKACNKCYDCIEECPMYAITPQGIDKGGPNLDCIKCGKCIEMCPQEAIDIYLRRTSYRARSWFIPIMTTFALIWMVWFITVLAQLAPSLLGL